MKNDKLIRLKSVLDQFQVSKSHWYELIVQGKAPNPLNTVEVHSGHKTK